ncbi:MAG: DNA-formamidopyrimidine glycosylase family protein [Acidimicrobiales bacterium]
MPEILEVEAYRRLADRAVGARIVGVDVPDPGTSRVGSILLRSWRPSRGVDRRHRSIGKLLLVGLGPDRPELGLRFGMTGRLVLGDDAPIERLEYSSGRDDPAWDRFAVRLDDVAGCA